jgi:serine/threonine protein kinase/tetratricopeptide (TPR) repeat protein
MAAGFANLGERVESAKSIFLDAIEKVPPDQWASYLDEACAGNATLRARVDKLLKAQVKLGTFHETPKPALFDEHACERPGTVIGPYKLLEQIGEGGMGLVFMAEQAQPIRRRVALKILKPGMDTRQVIARFEAERQALALMDHSHIAKIFDAGTTDSGRPYFVMELVRGVPITEYCDERRLTTRQRLELFVTVCQAVQHAHQKGVIHRDLKPSNVLVSHHDTVAVPKIIDFGIAKATGSALGGLTDRTLFTNFTLMLGTPLYMSPEQAEMNGLDVDTRSDVYSLGVMLYELLTGTTPFASDSLKKVGPDEMRRIIREEEPPPPSRRLSTLSVQACSTTSERRGADGRRLGQVLRGELDWIVMRALEKDRDRRYESASAFAADVQRYLNDEAVEACPPSAGYRLRKYVRRNRRVLVPLVAIAIVLAVATAVSAWLAVEANAARQLAGERLVNETAARRLADERLDNEKEARKEAATEAAIARAVNAFLQEDLLGQVGRVSPSGDKFAANSNLTVREALDRAAANIGQRFQDQPLVEAAIRLAIGNSYGGLFASQLAVPHLERAFALRQTQLGADHPETLRSMADLAVNYSWLGRHGDAIALYLRILENRTKTLGTDHPETLTNEQNLVAAYDAAGQYDKSIPLAEQLLEKQRTICGPTNSRTMATMYILALSYREVGRLDESIALYEQNLETVRSQNAPIAPYILGLAQACQLAGKLDRADKLLREALQELQTAEDSHRNRNGMANTLGWLALNLSLQRRYAEAEPLARQAVALNQLEVHRRFYWMSVLGQILLGQQKYAEAESLLLKGYEGMKQLETTIHANERRRLTEAGERVVRFYELTNQPEKAREWRDKIGVRAETKTPPKTKESKPE